MEKQPLKIKFSIAITLIIIFILIIAGIIYYGVTRETENTNSENVTNNENTNTLEQPKVTSLDIESEEVKNLYKYIMKINTNQEELVYRSTKVTEKDLNNQLKLMTIFENVDESDASEIKMLTDENGYEVEHTYYTKETIEEVAKKVFGDDVTITHESCESIFASARDYKDGVYDCYEYEGGGGVLWEDSTSKLISAEQSGDEIYIYDKYVHLIEVENIIDGTNYAGTYDIYEASDRQVKMAERVDFSANNLYDGDKIDNIENYLGRKLTTFKHTYKKNSDGQYYWYSTEPVK